MTYGEAELLRIAKRQNNAKRSYLLVNPLQAKHLPVSPSAALAMMSRLGETLAEKYPHSRLLIGFAETATAIGAAAAKCLGNDCIYLATTREPYTDGTWIEFLEEHSHATEQRLFATKLAEWIHQTESVILLDDELSTGKTLRNMVCQLRQHFPELTKKKMVAASILNRLTEENEHLLEEAGIQSEYLLKLPERDFSRELLSVETKEAREPRPLECRISCLPFPKALANPRFGLAIGSYHADCQRLSQAVLKAMETDLAAAGRILVLGTEECMFPALCLGANIESHFPDASVYCHATTRSPIGISSKQGYPITEGVRLSSLYDATRTTYLYNLAPYDLVLVLTDAMSPSDTALQALQAALLQHGSKNIVFLLPGKER